MGRYVPRGVLILVVVEEGLVRTEVICTSGKCFVLILVVVEDGLVQTGEFVEGVTNELS